MAKVHKVNYLGSNTGATTTSLGGSTKLGNELFCIGYDLGVEQGYHG